jgi:glutamine phosphoribosylpyrophosphate amidotransferase
LPSARCRLSFYGHQIAPLFEASPDRRGARRSGRARAARAQGLGTRLARRIAAKGWEIDCVVPVPDGSRPAAIQISAELGLPYREGLVKNRYVGRTFIMPNQRCARRG